jgi:VWFA-related protein
MLRKQIEGTTTALVVGAALLAGAPALPAQESSMGGAPRFGEAVEVRVVNVDVYVTDKKGRRISDLSREDFVIYQDSQQVEISNFSLVRGGQVRREPTVMAEELEPVDDDALTEIAEEVTVVIYIDNSTLTQPHRNRVLGDLEQWVDEQAGAGVRFMVAAFNPGLEIMAPVTTDATLAKQALRDIADMPASGLTALAERRQSMNLITDVYRLYDEASPGGSGQPGEAGGGNRFGLEFDPCTDGWGQLIASVDTYAQVAGARVSSAQAGLLGLTRSLGGVPGRKSILYLSDGLEQRPGIDMYAFLGELCPSREREMFSYMTRWDETPVLEELAEYANAHRVTLYALETAGLRSNSAASVEFDDKRFTPSARNDTLRISNLQSSLFIMADETGGRAFLNTNFPGPELARMAEDFSDYYSLGFTPPTGWDGESHSIRVELVGKSAKGAKLRYRKRYRAVPEDERMAERTLAALVMGWEDNPLGTSIRLGEQQPLEDEVWEVPVEIVLPVEALGSLPGAAGERQLVRVLMMAEDEKSRRTPMREKLIPLTVAEEAEAGDEPRTVVVNVQLSPGVHTIAIGVRDELSRVTSFHRAEVEIGAASVGTTDS